MQALLAYLLLALSIYTLRAEDSARSALVLVQTRGRVLHPSNHTGDAARQSDDLQAAHRSGGRVVEVGDVDPVIAGDLEGHQGSVEGAAIDTDGVAAGEARALLAPRVGDVDSTHLASNGKPPSGGKPSGGKTSGGKTSGGSTSGGSTEQASGSGDDSDVEGCQDSDWEDGLGNTCSDYESNSLDCSTPDEYLTRGVSAENACCKCGGGCLDHSNWTDKLGKDCNHWVGKAWCTSDGGYGEGWSTAYGSFEYMAEVSPTVACCGCGGGTLRAAADTTTTTTTTQEINRAIQDVLRDAELEWTDKLSMMEYITPEKKDTIYVPTDASDNQRMMKLWRHWSKSYTCIGQSCSDCNVSQSDCFSIDANDGFMKAKRNGSTTKMGFILHVNCPLDVQGLKLQLQFLWLQGGNVRSYWNGAQMTASATVLNFVTDVTNPSPIKPQGNSIRGLIHSAVLKPNKIVNEWKIEFTADEDDEDAEAHFYSMGFMVGQKFIGCAESKVCLNTFTAHGQAGMALRYDNTLQLRCLMDMPIAMFGGSSIQAACDSWRVCLILYENTNGISVRDELTFLLQSIGVSPWKYSGTPITKAMMTAGSSTATSLRTPRGDGDEDDVCMDPTIEDIESWDCSCYEEAQIRCDGISDLINNFDMRICLRALVCKKSNLCTHWSESNCNLASTVAYTEVLDNNPNARFLKAASNAITTSESLQQRSGRFGASTLASSVGDSGLDNELDNALSSKNCQ